MDGLTCLYLMLFAMIGVPAMIHLHTLYERRQRAKQLREYRAWLADWRNVTGNRYINASTNARLGMILYIYETGNADQKRFIRELAITRGTSEERQVAIAEHQADQLRQQAEQTRLVGRAVAWGNFYDTFHD